MTGKSIVSLLSASAAVLVVCLATGSVLAQMPGDVTETPPPPMGRMYAIYARGTVPERLHMDESLKPVDALLRSLPFTSYEAISVLEKPLPWGEESQFPINAIYSMRTSPLALDEDGTITLRAQVEMLQDEDYINALDTVAHAAPNKALMFRGMPLHAGELVIVLLVGMPPEDGESDASDKGEAESTMEGERPSEPETPEGEDEASEADQLEPEPLEPAAEEGEQPEGQENLEALLESLEEIDRREQIEERNRRDRIDFKGDWW